MRSAFLLFCCFVGISLAAFAGGYWFAKNYNGDTDSIISPVNSTEPLPLLDFTIPALRQRTYLPSQITIDEVLAENPDYTSYTFSYHTLSKRMTGVINVPTADLSASTSAVVMLRGYVPSGSYKPGVGTKNAAAVLASKGYITVAPDFFGYGGSDPEFSDSWQARFSKPIEVIELIKTLQTKLLHIPALAEQPTTTTKDIRIRNIGIWAHSNGGQIALTTLEVLGEPIPTTLWAPVTAPFPYSILFFSDEEADEGKGMRQEIASLEKLYDVFQFTLTKHLNLLSGSLQIHHGTADDAAPVAWTTEFVDKIKLENKFREQNKVAPIDLTYFIYAGADHNLQPNWDTVIQRDVEFFQKHLQT